MGIFKSIKEWCKFEWYDPTADFHSTAMLQSSDMIRKCRKYGWSKSKFYSKCRNVKFSVDDVELYPGETKYKTMTELLYARLFGHRMIVYKVSDDGTPIPDPEDFCEYLYATYGKKRIQDAGSPYLFTVREFGIYPALWLSALFHKLVTG